MSGDGMRATMGISLWGGQEVVLARAGEQSCGILALTVLLIGPGTRWEIVVSSLEGVLTVQFPPPQYGEGHTLRATRTDPAQS